jgi:hypothetical protein
MCILTTSRQIRHLICLAAALGAFSGLPGATAAENLIPNGDLENLLPGDLPEGMSSWTDQDHPVARYYVSQEEKTSGKNSLCIERLDDPVGNSRIGFGAFPVEPGKRYRFSCKVKTTETHMPATVIFQPLKDRQKGYLEVPLLDLETSTHGATLDGGILRLVRALAKDPDGFNKLEMTFTVPGDCIYLGITVDFSWNALGKAWFDDFELLPLQ